MITNEKNIQMLKQKLDHIRDYADELYEMLDMVEDTEVELPLWWLSKIIRSNDYISAAKHYLEYKLSKDDITEWDENESLEEKLDSSSSAGEWVRDFYKSDAPQFAGKDKKKRWEMAIAAYLNSKSKI